MRLSQIGTQSKYNSEINDNTVEAVTEKLKAEINCWIIEKFQPLSEIAMQTSTLDSCI